jgi:hypothetical protein
MESQSARNWSDDETDTLIDVWASGAVLSIFDGQDKNGKAYEYIAKQMQELGFNRSLVQVQTKVKSLRKSFHHAKDAVGKSGAGPDEATRICPQYSRLHSFLGTKPLVCPSDLLRTTGTIVVLTSQ